MTAVGNELARSQLLIEGHMKAPKVLWHLNLNGDVPLALAPPVLCEQKVRTRVCVCV